MAQPKYKAIAKQVEKHYWDKTFAEIAELTDTSVCTVQRSREWLDLPAKTTENKIEHKYGVPYGQLLHILHNQLGKSVSEMSDNIGIARKSINRYMDENDIYRRGKSEAEKLKWQNMTDEQRANQVQAAHEARRGLPSITNDTKGYEIIKHSYERERWECKHHRLIAVAEYGFDAVADSYVHHKIPIPWLNYRENLEVFDSHSEHAKHHNS